MKPSIGRIVLYSEREATVPAIVIGVNEPYDGYVAIRTLGYSDSITHAAVPEGDPEQPGHWWWPPRV